MEIKVQFMESDSDKMEIRGAAMQLETRVNAACRWYLQLNWIIKKEGKQTFGGGKNDYFCQVDVIICIK